MAEVLGIVLRVTRYSDRQSIVTLYSRERGALAVTVAAGGGRGAVRMRALTMPLGLVRCEVDIRPTRDVHPVRGMGVDRALPAIGVDPMKRMVAMFVAEVLWWVCRQQQMADGAMWEFAYGAVLALEGAAGGMATANFPIAFMVGLTRVLGVEPDVSTYAAGRLLDLREGVWRVSVPVAHGDYLDASQSRGAYMLCRMGWANMGRYRFNREVRGRVLDGLLGYVGMHSGGLSGLKSVDVLRTLL